MRTADSSKKYRGARRRNTSKPSWHITIQGSRGFGEMRSTILLLRASTVAFAGTW